jgi:hypothetical protein
MKTCQLPHNDFQPALGQAAERIFTYAELSMPRQRAAGIS